MIITLTIISMLIYFVPAKVITLNRKEKMNFFLEYKFQAISII